MELTATIIRAYALELNGATLHLQKTETWNGMMKLDDGKGFWVIVYDPAAVDGGFALAFDMLFADLALNKEIKLQAITCSHNFKTLLEQQGLLHGAKNTQGD